MPRPRPGPPARRDDLYREREKGAWGFLVIDGVFMQEDAVSPREVVDVLAEGRSSWARPAWKPSAPPTAARRRARCRAHLPAVPAGRPGERRGRGGGGEHRRDGCGGLAPPRQRAVRGGAGRSAAHARSTDRAPDREHGGGDLLPGAILARGAPSSRTTSSGARRCSDSARSQASGRRAGPGLRQAAARRRGQAGLSARPAARRSVSRARRRHASAATTRRLAWTSRTCERGWPSG